jgi:hypothetical protein
MGDRSPLEQHHKTEEKTTILAAFFLVWISTLFQKFVFCCNFNDFLGKSCENLGKEFSKTYTWFKVGSHKYTRIKFLFLSYFFNSQIWLSKLMDKCHLGYITKLEK